MKLQRILVQSSYPFVGREIVNGVTLFIREKRLPWELRCVTTKEFIAGIGCKPAGALCLLDDDRRPLAAIAKSRVPTVNMFRNLHSTLPSVTSDQKRIGENAADYFLGCGFRHFAFLGPDRDWSHARGEAFENRLRDRGQTQMAANFNVDITSVRVESGTTDRRALEKWIAALPKPIAIFTAADFISRILLDACSSKGFGVPDDVAILGVDNDVDICELAPIPLSSIPQDLKRIGFESARLLHDLMVNTARISTPIRIPPAEIIVRCSTSSFVFEDARVNLAMNLIHSLPLNAMNLKEVVKQAGVSRQCLDRRFKAMVGRTPSEEISRVRLQFVRAMLLESDLTLREIAGRCGFSNPENVTRFFRMRMGMSPHEFRRAEKRTTDTSIAQVRKRETGIIWSGSIHSKMTADIQI